MKLDQLLRSYTPGDVHSWHDEFSWLRENHGHRLRSLFMSVLQHGIREPVLLGHDGRVWDGHHRIYVAYHLGFTDIRVKE